MLIKPMILFEFRHNENDIINVALKFSFRLFKLLGRKVGCVPLVNSNSILLSFFVNLARNIDTIRLEFSLKLVKKFHMAALVMNNWNGAMIYI